MFAGLCIDHANVAHAIGFSNRVLEFFENLFPNEVAYACISVGMNPLAKAIKKRQNAIAAAEIAIAIREASATKERPVLYLYKGIPLHSVCHCRKVTAVDALSYYESEIAEQNKKIARYQLEARNAEHGSVLPPDTVISDNDINVDDDAIINLNFLQGKETISKKSVSGTGFVTFKSRRAQTAACQVALVSQKYSRLVTLTAPDPDDIIWDNVTTSKRYTDEAVDMVTTVYAMGIFFWGVVLAFIATISNLSNLSEYLPFIEDIDPALYAIIAGLLPVYALVLVLYLLPILMCWISETIEKRKTKSSIDFEVFSWYYVLILYLTI